jgi:hypothetical protein
MQIKIIVAAAMASAWMARWYAGREYQREVLYRSLKDKLPLIEERMTETFRTYMQAEQERTRRANAEHRAKTWLN